MTYGVNEPGVRAGQRVRRYFPSASNADFTPRRVWVSGGILGPVMEDKMKT